MAYKTTIDKKFDGDFKITIYHRITNGYEEVTPIVEDGVKWETDRQGSPGKLTFKVYADKNKGLNFQEGDEVHLNFRIDGKGWMVLFYGFIFTKKRNKNGWIDVTAYDQLRYFKNKGTYVLTGKKASDILKMIADDYLLKIGTIEETSYVIGQRVEDNQSLFDIIQNALDDTLIGSKKMYVLYADGTGVCLRNIESMKTDLVINHSVAEDFDYSSSIDEETYTEVELYYDDSEKNRRQYYHAYDPTNMRRWGRLRLTENIKNPTNAEDRVKKMLTLYNRKKRKLNVKGTFGDYRCRAGASVIVDLDLGDVTVSNYMLIEKATHTFKKNEYRMDLTLDGFNEDVSNANVTYKTWTLQGESKTDTDAENKQKVDDGKTLPEQVTEPTAKVYVFYTFILPFDKSVFDNRDAIRVWGYGYAPSQNGKLSKTSVGLSSGRYTEVIENTEYILEIQNWNSKKIDQFVEFTLDGGIHHEEAEIIERGTLANGGIYTKFKIKRVAADTRIIVHWRTPE